MKVIRVLEEIEVTLPVTAERQLRRVAILQRDDGHFAFAEEYFYTSEWEGKAIAQGWRRLSPEGIYLKAEITEAEGRAALLQRHT